MIELGIGLESITRVQRFALIEYTMTDTFLDDFVEAAATGNIDDIKKSIGKHPEWINKKNKVIFYSINLIICTAICIQKS